MGHAARLPLLSQTTIGMRTNISGEVADQRTIIRAKGPALSHAGQTGHQACLVPI